MDAISLTHVAVFAIPAGVWWHTGDRFWLWMIVAQLIGGVLVSGLKQWFGGGSGLWGRPAGAQGCDLWCVGGPVGGAPGFPSGHMTAVTLLVAGAYMYVGARWILILGIPWIFAMAWARWAKQCHTLFQIGGGSLLGVGLAYAVTHAISV